MTKTLPKVGDICILLKNKTYSIMWYVSLFKKLNFQGDRNDRNPRSVTG